MLRKLRKKFTMLYTISMGVILTIILTVVFLWSSKQQDQQKLENFSLQLNQVQYLFQKSQMLDSTELAQLEKENQLILHFEENGTALYYNGYSQPKTGREQLINQVIEDAREEGIYSGIYPSVATELKSSIFKIKGIAGESFYGELVILPTYDGWQSIVCLQQISETQWNLLPQFLLYLGIDLVGILSVFWVSRYFVARTMKPVEEGQRKQTEFIAAASHELRSPLAVIQTCASAILLSRAKQAEFVKDIEEECIRMGKLIDEMLLLASAETKNWTMRLDSFSLDNFLIEKYEKFLVMFQSKSQELTLELPDQMNGLVVADKERLYQVLGILLDNASTYSKEQTPIQLKVVDQKHSVQILIEDHGAGITDEDKAHIFERFYRADKSRNDKAHYGLGLSIAYELVKRMGGSLRVMDTDGGGSTFVIELNMGERKGGVGEKEKTD